MIFFAVINIKSNCFLEIPNWPITRKWMSHRYLSILYYCVFEIVTHTERIRWLCRFPFPLYFYGHFIFRTFVFLRIFCTRIIIYKSITIQQSSRWPLIGIFNETLPDIDILLLTTLIIYFQFWLYDVIQDIWAKREG